MTTERTNDGRLVLVDDYAGLRFTASDWHGGQWSAFYALSSTGTITHGLAREANDALRWIADGHEDDVAEDYDNLVAIGDLESLLTND